MFGEIVL